MSSLMHHGVKGQRWGVRRYQNKDGTRTALGKIRHEKDTVIKAGTNLNRITGNEHEVNEGYAYMSIISEDHEIYKQEASLGIYDRTTGKLITEIYDTQHTVTKDIHIPSFSNSIKAFEKVMADQDIDEIAKEVGDAYGSDNERHAQEFKNNYLNRDKASCREDAYYNFITSIGSEKNRQLLFNELKAEGYDAIWDENDRYEGWMKTPLIIFNRGEHTKQTSATKLNHTSIGGTMYIEGNALILGDSSYLEHHGIRGQRWGVRRFQNQDGSLTNAGRKRLGYATKGAAQTVGKAFKAGVKAGGNAVKAVKAHHEKAEAKKIEKKKEKASKTRLGVMANKDLFTNEELKKLNDRFKLEDEMKMATLQKGVEIAKAVGTIAQNVGTVAKAYEDVTGQSLSPIKRKAAEEKARQDAEDRKRKIEREDAEETRKAAKEERAIELHKEILRKNIADADTQEFKARQTKAEADSAIIDALNKAKKFNDDNGGGGFDPSGQSWMEKATAGGKNPFFEEKLKSDPELAAAKDAHDAKAERKQHEQERDARIAAREKEAAAKQSQPQQKQSGGDDDDALFSQKGSLPIDKDRYRNNRAMEKAKQVKEDAAEERAKKQDEKAAKATIDDMMEARRQFTDSARANSDGAFDRETASNYIKGKAKELPSKLNPINAIAKKITDKALKEQEAASRKAMEDEYKKTSRLQGRDEANYTMYYNRVNALQAQGYSERQAKKVADTESPFSSKRNRRFEYNEKVGEIETTHRKNSKEINKAEKASSDKYYELRNKPGYEWGTPKREALERKFAEQQATIAKLREDNDAMLDRERKKAKKILEHSFSIQNGVLFVDSSDGFAHHGIKGQRWGVRRFQNADGTRTALGKKREMYGATVSVRGQKSSESVGVTKKQAKGKAAAEILRNNKDLSEKERKSLQKHVDRAEKETAKLEKYKEKKKRSQEENVEEAKVEQWNMMTSGMISPDRYKQNIDTINKNHKREIDYLNKMDERDMANEKAFTRKTVAKGMGFALAATAGLAGITAAATGWMVISGYAAIGGGMVGVISGEMKRGQYRDQRRKEMGIDDPGRGKVKGSVYAKHDAFAIQDGTLFINAGEPYLEHHGVKGMKWGKHLMAGKGVDAQAGGGGGFAEDDEKLKEMAKKAGMSVAEYRQKFASKIGGAASKVGEKISVKDKHLVINGSRSGEATSRALAKRYLPFDSENSAARPKDTRSFKEKAYDALGGKYKTQASEAHKDMVHYKNEADDLARRANAQSRAVKNAKKKGAVQDYIANKEGARQLEEEAKGNRFAQWDSAKKANSAQWKYDHSIAGLYDKATGKYKQGHKKTKVSKLMDQAKYYYKEGSNNKLYNNGASKAKTAKEQAKAEVWKAADHVINSHNYYNQSYDPAVTAYGLDTAYRKEAVKYGRLAEGSYRRAAALGKQASGESSTSSRPRARKKKHTSGGTGVHVRRPGRKPVARTKRVTQSSTGVKRRGSTGTRSRVRRGA